MSLSVMEARSILSRTPVVLDAWLRDLSPVWLDCDDGPGTWTPRQVLGHLIHGERTDWIPRLRHLLEHEASVPFEPFDRTAHLRNGPVPVAELLDTFAELRSASLQALDAVSRSGFPSERRGLHPELGTVTAAQLLATWTAHDLGHLVQIGRTMARRYSTDVGPWGRYLSVMSR
jgi:hypothetical protein